MPHGALDPEKFRETLMAWTSLLLARLEAKRGDQHHAHIAIDGKTIRRSHDFSNDRNAIHMLNVWSVDHGISLGQIKTADKSNEIKAIPELLALLDIRNTTITTDAMGCQREIASTIIVDGGDYLLAVKDNQPNLHHQIKAAFEYANGDKMSFSEMEPMVLHAFVDIDKGHGRIEERGVQLSRDLDWIPNGDKWSGLNCVVKVTRRRTIIKTDKTSEEVSYVTVRVPTSSISSQFA